MNGRGILEMNEEAMVREMEVVHSWIEEEEYKIDRDRFGDG